MLKDFPLIKELIETSRMVREARHEDRTSLSNETLAALVKSSPDHLLAPIWSLWMGDTSRYDARFEEALEHYEALIRAYPKALFSGQRLLEKAVYARSICYERLGDRKMALAELERLLSTRPDKRMVARVYARIGRLHEVLGDSPSALEAYKKGTRFRQRFAADTDLSFSEVCRRHAMRLSLGEPWVRASAELLAEELAAALVRQDMTALKALASQSHFTVGAGSGEGLYIEPGAALKVLKEELKKGDVRVNPQILEGGGAKRYLEVKGLSTDPVYKRLLFMFTRTRAGWAWSGITGFFDDVWRLFLPCSEIRDETTSPELAIEIKAPWPEGIECWAGGLGGLYYNTATTHCGFNAFAIDFGRLQATAGTPVLAVREGLVTRVLDDREDGDESRANSVKVEHPLDAEILLSALVALFGDGNYAVRYQCYNLHLRGPDLIPVSEGMWVDQGTTLGQMDDTGLSLGPHLHFALEDKLADEDRGRLTVMPSPLDGVTLGLGDGGTLIKSTNAQIP